MKTIRRIALVLVVVALACPALAARPNVVIFLADDAGWGDLSFHGNTNLATPRIDSLAADGASFERFFVCPVCSPTRAEFLTGRYHPRGGVWSTSTGGERLNLDEQMIAQVFKAAGYATGAFGKWHNGTQYPYHPNARGFDEFYGFCSGHWGHYFDPVLEHNGRSVRGKGYIADDFTDHAIGFIEANRAGPFLCYVPFNTPHSPMQAPERFFKKFKDAPLAMRHQGGQEEDPAMTRAALAMVENIDWNVGRVLDKLDELKLAENTVVVFFNDNGPNSWRWNGGLKGRKGSTDEGGVRSPLFVRFPGRIPPGNKIDRIAGAIDLLPTLAGLAGIDYRPARPLDGVNLENQLTALPEEWPDRKIFSHWAGKVSVRTQQFRLDDQGRLFDMRADAGQRREVTHRDDMKQELIAAVEKWRREVLAGIREDKRPFTVGYPQFPITQLPARDGVAHGTIRRSARAPNCSFFENWTALADKITWDVEVHTPGKYRAVVYYACPAADVGSTVELSLGDARTSAVVSPAHDPPLVGAREDRVPRVGESLVKDFAPLELGVLELVAGRGLLTLSAVKMPGQRVMDVRGVELTLVP